jgi:hypothetical protein
VPPAIFSLFALLFVGVGVLNVLKPREMTAYQIKRRSGVEGTIEPTETRIMLTRIFGVIAIIFGLSFLTGIGLF